MIRPDETWREIATAADIDEIIGAVEAEAERSLLADGLTPRDVERLMRNLIRPRHAEIKRDILARLAHPGCTREH